MIFKEEKMMIMSSTDDQVQETLNTEIFSMKKANVMTTTKVKIKEVREENERLKLALSQILKDYDSLKMRFGGITQEDDQSKKATTLASMAASEDESDLVSLSLGRFSSDSTREDKKINDNYKESKIPEKNGGKLDGIELGLNYTQHSDNSVEVSRTNLTSENSLDEESKEEVRLSPKNSRTHDQDNEILQQNPLKKPRVSVRAVCNTQTMQDGCQWRKYGQKIAKGNPCPSAYYRCTVSSSCPVRKQVQRCIDDMSILITTYEGTHNHPLGPSATNMASATTAAVAMLSCGSSASPRVSNPAGLFGYNGYPRATISSSLSHPTVILDLTAPNHHNKLFSSSTATQYPNSPSSFNFSSNFPTMNNARMSPYSQLAPPSFNDEKITAAITHDPNFQSALAAAITSFVGNNNINVGGRNSGLVDFHHLNFSQPPAKNNASIGCAAASFINRFPQ